MILIVGVCLHMFQVLSRSLAFLVMNLEVCMYCMHLGSIRSVTHMNCSAPSPFHASSWGVQYSWLDLRLIVQHNQHYCSRNNSSPSKCYCNNKTLAPSSTGSRARARAAFWDTPRTTPPASLRRTSSGGCGSTPVTPRKGGPPSEGGPWRGSGEPWRRRHGESETTWSGGGSSSSGSRSRSGRRS